MNDTHWPSLHREQIGPIIGRMNGLPVRVWYTQRTEQPIDAAGRAIEVTSGTEQISGISKV